ncbi:MAG: HAD hydrolase family protein [Balneolales bacterium]
MVKLFVLDIDGCITFPFVTPEWDVIKKIRDLQARSREDEQVPELSICTGRPLPYAEAVAQWLDIRKPIIFESGGGLFDPKKYHIEWSKHLDNDILDQMGEIKEWVEREIIPNFKGSILEVGKHMDVGLISMDPDQVLEIYKLVKPQIEKKYTNYVVHRTDVSVNIILEASNKGSGLLQLADYTGIPLQSMAYIGDSSGDVAALEISGTAFAPANATEEVKELKDVICLKGSATKAVLEGYEMLVKKNKKKLKETTVD